MVDDAGFEAIMAPARRAEKFIQNGEYVSATNEWRIIEGVVGRVTQGIDFYNVLTKISADVERGTKINLIS